MYLQHDNIVIRNATAADAPQLAAWWNDGSVMAHAGFPLGLGTSAEKIAADLANDTDTTRRRLMLLISDTPIGEMCCYNAGNNTAEIGIKICKSDHQEKGIGRIALSMLLGHLFAAGYCKIVLDTNLKNTRAQHVYEKLGFRQTAVHLNSWKNQLGESESSVDYELLPADFVDFTV